MLSCNAGIAEMTDKAAVPAAAEHREVAADSAYNSEISRPSVDRNSRIAGNDRKWSTLPANNGFEDTYSTKTAHDVESGASTWDSKLVTFTQVAEQRRAQLVGLAQRITHDRDEAEDVVQEALLRAFKSLPQFRGESQIGTWLCVIVKNTGCEWLRIQRGRVFLSLEHARSPDDQPILLDFPDPGRNPEQCCVRKEMDDILLSEIARLNSVCGSTIQMCAIEERSHWEAAHALGVSVAAIKARVFRAKQMLKRAVCVRTGARVD